MALISEIMNGLQEFVTNAANTITSDHANIHKGLGGIAADYRQLTASQVKSYCFTVPADRYVHFKNLDLKVLGSSVKLEILRDADVTVNTGSEILSSNPNAASNKTPKSVILEDPTFTGGTNIEFVVALADATNQNVGMSNTSQNINEELVFAPGEQYIIRLTELTANPVSIFWRAFWYEQKAGVS